MYGGMPKSFIEIRDGKENGPSDQTDASVGKEGDDSWLNIPGLFERFTRLRNSKGADKKMTAHRPKVLTEVGIIGIIQKACEL